MCLQQPYSMPTHTTYISFHFFFRIHLFFWFSGDDKKRTSRGRTTTYAKKNTNFINNKKPKNSKTTCTENEIVHK